MNPSRDLPVIAAALAGLLLTGTAAAAPVQAAPEDTVARAVIRGVVQGRSDRGPRALFQALVEWSGGDRPRMVFADSTGAYRLPDVPAGRGRLRVVHVGFASLEMDVVVPTRGTVVLDVELEPRPVAVAPLTVWADPQAPSRVAGEPPGPELAEVALRALDVSTGMAESGLGSAAGRLRGDGAPGDPRDVLFMRGSTAELKLVLLDGAPVYAPFHLGGLIQTFDPNLLGGASLYVGGAPARYDGGLAYILDLGTRSAGRDSVSGAGSLDLMSGGGSLSVPLGASAGLLVGARGLHGVQARILDGARSPYGYVDGLARLDVDVGARHRLRATVFANRESVTLDAADAGPLLPEAARWGNAAGSVGWEAALGETTLRLNAAASRYEARLPLGRAPGVLARGTTDRLRWTADLDRPWGRGHLRYGATVDRIAVAYDARKLNPPADEPLRTFRLSDAATVAGAYGEAAWPLGATVRLTGGLRVDHFSSDGSVRVAPRVDVAWAMTDQATLSLAGGLYHQYAPVSDGPVETALQDSAGTVPPGPVLPVAGSSHLVVSLDQVLSPRLSLGLEGWVKRFDGLGRGGTGGLDGSGVDLRLRREGASLTGWLGYSLSWLWSAQDSAGASSRFAGRHLLSAGLSGWLGERIGGDLRIAFGDGLPFTAVEISADGEAQPTSDFLQAEDQGSAAVRGDAALSGGPADRFLRVDAQVSGRLTTEWGGRTVELRPYLKLLNALDSRDALFYYFEPWRDDEVRPLAERSLLPVVGVEWTF